MFLKSIRISVIASLLLANSLYANDGFEDDEFEDEEVIEIVKLEKNDNSDFIAYGDFSLFSSYNYSHDKPIGNTNDFRGLSSAKVSTNINIEKSFENGYKLKSTLKAYKNFIYDLKDDDYKTTPKDYEQDVDINEIYLQGNISEDIDFKTGRQVIVWGKSDNIRITDTLNPLDKTTLGVVDIEDLRLGRFMTKVNYYIDKWSVSAIVLHENRYSKLPQYGSDFASSNKNIANNMSIKEPNNNLENTGIALSVNGNLEGEDLSFYYSNQYIDNTNYKSNMLGFAYNKVIDSFLFKTESAYFDNYDNDNIKSKINSLIGLEYNGISDGSISLELANNDRNIQYALRFTQSYMNQTLDFTTLYSAFGKKLKDGGFVRSWFEYDINDNFSTNFGFINYISGDAPQFKMIKDNDRLFASLKYNF